MCLAIPSKVIAIKDNVAILETLGVQREASLDLMGESVKVGDYVLLHIGYVMSKIDEKEALESIELYQEMIAKMNETHE
ncbi:HypC/HybG/HupF family hydrogenase formation chaperone [Helicobacter pylori]|uniref:HypC/HybG/HupF family hydrogenase formation chaperone n=1 Tax=Helicobacter pylori TaxID=210 RepID=A0A438SLN8_HELPX|nr:HypC/HybG/HupF family hydrogenase formation chaperone [Helicobacter pylori]EJC13032.1 hydrogenase assembly chaperone HypC/HupF [Helicobacter pylori Hp P-23]KAA6497262.1 HypC/HybG/HupF family hydrogenase formation chaperone [Helicobacter pylori]KAA6498308.1 HypC/HybG/HupF family hydrogenase formation chaperone [Helicobacter pylori]KAA6502575.1 HypC/HybG/HupF family hydrogenase formation chaperone [Helicobacter pylori]MBH0233159.1 HypC/HybG/HupF family hydrogenase formation chaperone [Helicob